MNRSVTHKIVYEPQLRSSPYNILWVTSRSINCHMALSTMNYLLNIIWHKFFSNMPCDIYINNFYNFLVKYVIYWVILQNCFFYQSWYRWNSAKLELNTNQSINQSINFFSVLILSKSSYFELSTNLTFFFQISNCLLWLGKMIFNTNNFHFKV